MGDFSGGGSDKSTSNSNTTNTTNIDRRQVVSDSAVGITSDGSTVNITSVDTGLVGKALDTVAAADATSGQGFTQLLSLADKMFTGAGHIIQSQQDATLAQMQAINTSANDKTGRIDQKTMVMLAGAAALTIWGISKK